MIAVLPHASKHFAEPSLSDRHFSLDYTVNAVTRFKVRTNRSNHNHAYNQTNIKNNGQLIWIQQGYTCVSVLLVTITDYELFIYHLDINITEKNFLTEVEHRVPFCEVYGKREV